MFHALKRLVILGSLLLFALKSFSKGLDEIKALFPQLEVPVIEGELKLVYEPKPTAPNTWFVNDHTLIQDKQGRIHFLGIENPYPTTGQACEWVKDEIQQTDRPFILTLKRMMGRHLYRRNKAEKTHLRVGHAVAESIMGPWKRLPAVLDASQPNAISKRYASTFAVNHDHRYWLFVHSDGTGIYTSQDLNDWTYVENATPWEGGSEKVFGKAGHRDPCIRQLQDGSFLQYFACTDVHGRYIIGLASSSDLKIWHKEKPCYVEEIPDFDLNYGIFESPFVVNRNGLYYLFVCFAHRHYYETFIVVSDNPYHFSPDNKITTLMTHAPEIIEIDGQMYMSSCGVEDPQNVKHSGLWMTLLKWLQP
jgi:hypothetical protein